MAKVNSLGKEDVMKAEYHPFDDQLIFVKKVIRRFVHSRNYNAFELWSLRTGLLCERHLMRRGASRFIGNERHCHILQSSGLL